MALDLRGMCPLLEVFDMPTSLGFYCDVLGFEKALVDDEKKELTVSAARCSAPDYMHRMPIRMEGSLIEYVIRQGHPIIIPSIHNEKQYRYPELARKSGLTSLLAAPLTSQGKVIGSINIYTRDERAFSDDEVGFVKVVAGQAAIAIQAGPGAFGNAATRLEAQVVAGGVFVYGSYPDIDALYARQATEADHAQRTATLHEIQRLIHERVRFGPIYEYIWPSGIGPRVAEPALMLIDPYPWSAPLEDVKLKAR